MQVGRALLDHVLEQSLDVHRCLRNLFCLNEKKRLTVLDGLSVLDQDFPDHTAKIRTDLVHQLHRLDDAYGLTSLDGLADLDERLRPRGR